MAKKNKNQGGLVYSTDPNFTGHSEEENSPQESIAKQHQKLKVLLDSKQRGGKIVTLVCNYQGSDEDLQALGKLLKTKCGAGGSVKDGEIIVQGNYKDKVIQLLQQEGYLLTK